jgi:putative ABC transport system permease protein
MFKNYLKTALRNIFKNKGYSFLNIFGLAIGITCAALIMVWIEDEKTFNNNFSKKDDLYRVMENQKDDGKIVTNSSTPGPMAQSLKSDIPGIKNAGRLSWSMDEVIQFKEKTIKETGGYVDPAILSMLSLPFVKGNENTAFNTLHSVVISKTLAESIFGTTDVIGKTIKMNAHEGYSVDGVFAVTGVYDDFPKNSSYQFKWIVPYELWEETNSWIKPWNNNLTETLVELESSTNPSVVNGKLLNYLNSKINGNTTECFLFSMNDWHLRNQFENGKITGGNIKYVRLFSLIALIILVIGCVNFMNLATARSEQRAKEVGILKVMGARKGALILKFIGEAVSISFIAVLLSIILLYTLMPFYGELVQKQLSVNLFNPQHFAWLGGIVIVAGLLAGSYPSFYLSSFNPVKVLNGSKIKSSPSGVLIRKGLVICQFTVSVILIFCTIIFYQQIQHIKTRNLGYDKNNLIYTELQGNVKEHFDEVKSKLLQTGYVENAAMSLHSALQVYSYNSSFSWQGKDPANKTSIHSNSVSAEFISTMHMHLIEGRDFYSRIGVDSNSLIINESMAKLMGKEGKVGAGITVDNYHGSVVGIIKDFVYNDMYGQGQPLIFFCIPSRATILSVRFKSGVDLSKAILSVSSVMKNVSPGYSIEFKFLDADFNQLFATETLTGKLAGIFAALAIFISCLGLFGLASYTAERRKKEIGIRKILGASTFGLTGLISREFLQLVTLACLVAFPVAWWFMHDWLQDYAYRTAIYWWIFPLTGITAILIAFITVAFQAIKAAITNPVKSMRSE